MKVGEDFMKYLLGELRDHLFRLQELSELEVPDSDRIEYHYGKATGIIDTLEGKGAKDAIQH